MKVAISIDGLRLRQAAARAAIAALAATSFVLAGCAGGSWLESPSEADLPLDESISRYPTAIESQPAGDGAANQPVASPPTPASETVVDASKAPRPEQPPPQPLAPLAVVPAHLRNQQPIPIQVNPEQQPIPAVMPATAAPPPSEPSAAAPSPPQTPATSVPLAALANIIQPLSATAAERSSVTITDEPTSPSTEKESAPPDRPASIDRTRTDLIAALEAEIQDRRYQNDADPDLPRLEQQLRLLYLTADRLDDAAGAVESLDDAQREAYKQLMFGLGVWLSPDEARRAPLRTAKVLRSLRDATSELAVASKLELHNLVFCERVDQFGWYTEFSRNEFQPKQQVLLYVEVENFVAPKVGAGYETELQGSYQIFDASGQVLAERQLPLDKEICRNYRRDYFLAYRIYMPENIEPGRYRLELTVEDLKAGGTYQGRKFGEGMIEFSIRR